LPMEMGLMIYICMLYTTGVYVNFFIIAVIAED
jgi:hypothetical protein